jgi:hypothetical protein
MVIQESIIMLKQLSIYSVEFEFNGLELTNGILKIRRIMLGWGGQGRRAGLGREFWGTYQGKGKMGTSYWTPFWMPMKFLVPEFQH